MASTSNSLPLRANSAADTPPPDTLPHADAETPATTETIVEKNPSSGGVTKISDPPSRRHKSRSGSTQYPGPPLANSRYAHQPQPPPTPILTPPTSAAAQPLYQNHLGSHAPSPYHTNQGYYPHGAEYMGPYVPGNPTGQQSRRQSLIQGNQCAPGYPHSGEAYPFGGPADDGHIYGLNPAGADSPTLPYDVDLETIQGALSALHSAVPNLQHIYVRYRHISEELGRCRDTIALQEKETEELKAKESQLANTNAGLGDTLQKNTGELNNLKLRQRTLEKEKQELQGVIRNLESEKSELGKGLEKEKAAFEEWKVNALSEREAQKSALELEKSELEKKFEGEKVAFEEWKDRVLNDRETEKSALELEKSELEKKLEEEKGAFDEWKVNAQNDREIEGRALIEAHAAEKKRLEESFTVEKKAIGEKNLAKINELHRTYKKKLESLDASSDTKLKEAEERHRANLKATNDTHIKKVTQLEETHNSQLEELEKKFYSDKETLKQHSDAQVKAIEDDFARRKHMLTADFESDKKDIIARYNGEISKLQEIVSGAQEDRSLLEDAKIELEKEKVENSALKLEKESLVSKWDQTKTEWETQKSELEAKVETLENLQAGLEAEKQTLSDAMKEMANAYEGSGLGSRSDDFYTDAFEKLGNDIVAISKEFSHLPTESLNKILAELPPGLPAMFDNTEASRHIRMAYVQHIISKHLCHRVFEPFYFSLRRRSCGNADEIFSSISSQLREMSTRKEAAWRRYTLIAGFRTPDAKKSAERTGHTIFKEIAERVEPFADPDRMGIIRSGISRIVKCAIETWRYARTERETIVASMGPDDGTNENSWGSHPYELQKPYAEDQALVSHLKTMTPERKVIIHLLPVFFREGTLPPLDHPSAELGNGMVFSKGIALYTDCLPVLQRKHALGPLTNPTPSLTGAEEAEASVKGEDGDSPGSVKEDEAGIEGAGESIAQEEQAPLPQGEAEEQAPLPQGEAKEPVKEGVELEVTEQPAGGLEWAPTAQEGECSGLTREATEAGTAASERTPTELGMMEDEEWDAEDTGKMVEQALKNVRDMEQEALHFVETPASEKFEVSSETKAEATSQTEPPLTPSPPTPSVHIPRASTPPFADETVETDDTVETAPEHQPCDFTVAINDDGPQRINPDATPPAAKAKDVFEGEEAVENFEAEAKDDIENNKTENEPVEKVAATNELEYEPDATGGVMIPGEITVTAEALEIRGDEIRGGVNNESLDGQGEKRQKKKGKKQRQRQRQKEQKEQGQQQPWQQQPRQQQQQQQQQQRERSQAGTPNPPSRPSQIPTRTMTPATSSHSGTSNSTWRPGLMRAAQDMFGNWRQPPQAPTYSAATAETPTLRRDIDAEEGHADSETDASTAGRSPASSASGNPRRRDRNRNSQRSRY